MEKYTLDVKKRTVMGKKVKLLRKQGKVVGNIFGKKTASQAIEIDAKAFKRVFAKAGLAAVIHMQVDEEKESRPVLVSNVQHHPISGLPVHVDFHQVSLTEKVQAEVPVQIEGTASAVEQKIGALLTPTAYIQVEALPTDLPEHIVVDVSALAALDQEIRVKDIVIAGGKVKILTEPEVVIARIGPLVSKEAEELAREEAAKAEAAAAATAAATGEAAPAEGAAPKAEETKPKEEAKPAEGKPSNKPS